MSVALYNTVTQFFFKLHYSIQFRLIIINDKSKEFVSRNVLSLVLNAVTDDDSLMSNT